MGGRPSVLLVEDNDETRDVLARVLAVKGYDVHGEPDGQMALAWLRAANRPAVIILDLYLPVLDGEAFLRELKGDASIGSIPVVAFTAHAGQPPAGLSAFVRKGTDDPDVLLEALAACLER